MRRDKFDSGNLACDLLGCFDSHFGHDSLVDKKDSCFFERFCQLQVLWYVDSPLGLGFEQTVCCFLAWQTFLLQYYMPLYCS